MEFDTLKKIKRFIKSDITNPTSGYKNESAKFTFKKLKEIHNTFKTDFKDLIASKLYDNELEAFGIEFQALLKNTFSRRYAEVTPQTIRRLKSSLVEVVGSFDKKLFESEYESIKDRILNESGLKKIRKGLFEDKRIESFCEQNTFWKKFKIDSIQTDFKPTFIKYVSTELRLEYWMYKKDFYEIVEVIFKEGMQTINSRLEEHRLIESKRVVPSIPANHFAIILYLCYRINGLNPLLDKSKNEFTHLICYLLFDGKSDFGAFPEIEDNIELDVRDIIKKFKPRKRKSLEDVKKMLSNSKVFDLKKHSTEFKSNYESTLNKISKEYIPSLEKGIRLSAQIKIALENRSFFKTK